MMSQPVWTHLHAKLHQTLRQRPLIPKKQSILVAVSGGQDSLCLLKLLLDLQSKWQWQVAIAHCDHCWFSDAGIAEHVEKIAGDWQVPFYLKTAATQSNFSPQETEAAARKWRYQALTEIAQENSFSVIVTGHTLSDRAETLLYNLMRGSGADGLHSLTWQRYLTTEIQLVRPLLNVSRQETGDFCQQFQLPVWEDAVNQNLRYARNRIRGEVIPYLKTHFNPQVEKCFAQTAELLRADVDFLEQNAQELLSQAILPQNQGLKRTVLRGKHLALQRRVMRKFLWQTLPQAPNFEEIEALTNLIHAPNRTRTSSLPGGLVAEVEGENIRLVSQGRNK